jgi:hypothetical protein
MGIGVLLFGIPTAILKWVLKGGKVSFWTLLYGKKNGSLKNYDGEKTYVNAIIGAMIIVAIVLINFKLKPYLN